MENIPNVNTHCNWRALYSHHRAGTRTGGFGNQQTNGVYPNYRIVEVGLIIEKSPKLLEDFLSLRLQWKTISLHWCDDLSNVSIIIIMKKYGTLK